jgi:hypothetical protein
MEFNFEVKLNFKMCLEKYLLYRNRVNLHKVTRNSLIALIELPCSKYTLFIKIPETLDLLPVILRVKAAGA